ncbi:ZIP family metal transporter [Pseudomonas sp. gcc21]|uniref:ZIP family metal transporter n=1 Tax=Pseudomonas sp. gcc21 TaxID=2726989 RepID=UPI00211426C3|nr:peptidoglycan-binding protein [Pseudomonas sp. gcc21]
MNKALHAASGIVLAVVSVELMPEVLATLSGWAVGVAFGLGGIAYIAIETAVDGVQRSQGRTSTANRGMWMIYIAVAIDLFSDGLLIGTGSAVAFSMAVVLALGQVLADVPEGYATIANMKEKGVPRARRMVLSTFFFIPVISAAMLAYYVLRDQSEAFKMMGLAFTAGLLTVAAVEDMLSEAHETTSDSRGSVLAFMGGFVLFTFVSAGLGG